MASVVFDRRRGIYYIQWFNGTKYTRNPAYQIARWKKGNARPARDPAEVTASLAAHQDKEKRAKERGAMRSADETVAAFLESYRQGYTLCRASGSAEELRKAVEKFVGWCDGAKVKKLAHVTPKACLKFLTFRAGQPSRVTGKTIAYATLVKEKALLGAAWQQAVDLGEIEHNPWSKVEIPAKQESRVKGSWSPEDYRKILDVSRPWLRDIVTVGCHCGLRITALLGLEWRDIRWADAGVPGDMGEIIVRPELDKIGRGYRVPIHPAAHDVLMRRKLTADGDRVLTGQGGQPTEGSSTGQSISLACLRAGLTKPSSPNHHLRRTFGRWAVLGQLTGQPVPLYVVSRWMGHATVEMTEKYLSLPRDVSAQWMTGSESDHP